jgi:carbon-monoxide dehydrogenase small subunit
VNDSASSIELSLNGRTHTLAVPVRATLADAVRALGATGTHIGCEHGACGTCTVLLDGEPVRGCLVLALQADGRSVTTVEGLGADRALHAVQRAFLEHNAFQCGLCTPGFVVLAASLLEREPNATADRIVDVLSANLCRCTGYTSIVAAVRAAQAELR